MADQIGGWIAHQVTKAGKRGVVVGVSGGLDSAVALDLAVRGLGAGRVLAFYLPERGNQAAYEDVKELCGVRGVRYIFATIGSVTDVLERVSSTDPNEFPEADRNLRPRIRMTLLYHAAQRRDSLVLGTSNRTEYMIGYFTKHGDGAADIFPLRGLYKTEVRALAAGLSLPKNILTKPPSADLYEGQTDEADLGMTYKKLDTALAELLGDGRNVSTHPATLDRVRGMVLKNAHKREAPPVWQKEDG